MGEIISASRRTDIPAFFWEWFMEKLEEEKVDVKNPYSGKNYSLSLSPGDVDCIVFWTKNPDPATGSMKTIEEKGYRSLFHVTINGYGKGIEGRVPDWKKGVESLRTLSRIIGKEKVFWRFDPLLPFEDPLDTVKRFESIARNISGYAERCYIATFHPYRKSLRQLAGGGYKEEPSKAKDSLYLKLLEGGRKYSIPLYGCCSPLLESRGFPRGSCIDGEYLSKVFGKEMGKKKRASREGCNCAYSRDLGFYGSCSHGCLYCYAS